ncbi:MAG: hypothetical protein JSS16_00415 [Proteobacteria bacterium]|jgi:hypothetical protein|nr:hypothetical protein [Pseudomonadota bacterium]
MDRSLALSPTRLRRHRGLWVLAAIALLIKLASGMICLADGQAVTSAAIDPAVVCTTMMASIDIASTTDDGDTCLLGEAGGCHCACAHNVPLPSTTIAAVAVVAVGFYSLSPHSEFAPAANGSLLRPPIA